MTKHTPGPWHINTAGSASRGEPFKITEIYVYAPDTQDDTAICADVIDPVTQEPSEANARLIAAAPDLLEALQAAVECGMVPISSVSEGGASRHSRQVQAADMIRAAIQKATKEQV